MPVEFYNNILYPLQDKAIPVFKDSPFYLTGGTTLSRGYYNHRYSDDLDYFLNDHPDFQVLAERQVERLSKIFDDLKVVMSYERFYRVFVSENRLKIEMVNDVPSHIGILVNHPVLGVIDSKENILANKISAIVDRILPKDMVDVFFLLKDGLSIKQSLLDAHSKAAGIAPLVVAKIFSEFDYELAGEEIKWVTPVPVSVIKEYLSSIAVAIVEGRI